jgi:hypothetical protein
MKRLVEVKRQLEKQQLAEKPKTRKEPTIIHNGMTFEEIAAASIPVKGIFAVGNQRFIITGQLQITKLTDSVKFGSEIQFKLRSTEQPKTEVRTGKQEFSTLEIDLPTVVGEQIIRDAYKTFPREILTLKSFESVDAHYPDNYWRGNLHEGGET